MFKRAAARAKLWLSAVSTANWSWRISIVTTQLTSYGFFKPQLLWVLNGLIKMAVSKRKPSSPPFGMKPNCRNFAAKSLISEIFVGHWAKTACAAASLAIGIR
jgi:hypothetical protein